ncbi:hypothetical protein [Mucilaginibacter aquatilis]|uniref:Uncharacterized protein n=1 Tax=Mucilaginibacter aquatilis TaxID=1517760 RepID=A0A6I4IR00_9SPHI|nr:hypothetical protein [Mucilaginibacter aquatilis]MVN92673.1 hypothetical protein [Mucilaginibacter aquatilis]
MNYQHIILQNIPLHLAQREINDLIGTIADFFMSDRLPGHLKKLKVWRNNVVNDRFFTWRNRSPADLLMIHRDVVRLVEVAFLLNMARINFQQVKLDAENFDTLIAAERNDWECHAEYLSEKQLANPMRTIRKFCKAYTMHEYREHLAEWLTYGLSKHACIDYEPYDIIRVYENLQKLFEACWLIRNRCLPPLLKS